MISFLLLPTARKHPYMIKTYVTSRECHTQGKGGVSKEGGREAHRAKWGKVGREDGAHRARPGVGWSSLRDWQLPCV